MENRPMRGWVLITRDDADDYREDEGLLDAAIAHVAGQAAEAPPKPARRGKAARAS